MNPRVFHRRLGLGLCAFLLTASATGVLRAHAKWLYWKERPAKEKAVPLALPRVGIERPFEASREVFGPAAPVERVELKQLAQEPFYVVAVGGAEKETLLVDAASGRIIRRIGSDMAVRIARPFVGKEGNVVRTEEIASFRARKAAGGRPVHRVLFDDPARTEIFVDQQTGEVVSVLDRGRRFGLWVARVHELDFGGMGGPALTLLGLGTWALALAGLRLGFPGKRAGNIRRETP